MNYFFVWAVIQKYVSLQFSVQKNQQFAEKQTKKVKTNLKKKERKKQKKESASVKGKLEKIRIRDLRKDSLDVCILTCSHPDKIVLDRIKECVAGQDNPVCLRTG